ncbi:MULTISPECIES: hypothetical protein [Cupriavidus]|uniref:hypothetical protein n=1 Tax=Cupriavidus sp. DF5525 TaxID=3160989 RepID=UPI0003B0C655|nr:hypothetical protein N234_14135 [Ralstonia pickettii DTP0602]
MADAILAAHPLRTLPQDSDLSCVLDLENPFYMTLERLEGLITTQPAGEIRAYLYGLWDMRRAAVYAEGA